MLSKRRLLVGSGQLAATLMAFDFAPAWASVSVFEGEKKLGTWLRSQLSQGSLPVSLAIDTARLRSTTVSVEVTNSDESIERRPGQAVRVVTPEVDAAVMHKAQGVLAAMQTPPCNDRAAAGAWLKEQPDVTNVNVADKSLWFSVEDETTVIQCD